MSDGREADQSKGTAHMAVMTSRGDLFGRQLVAAARSLHTPAECGRTTLPSVGRRYIFSPDGLPTYVRKRKCRHATLPHRCVVHAFTARLLVYITLVYVRNEVVCERPRARFRERSTSWTGFIFMD